MATAEQVLFSLRKNGAAIQQVPARFVETRR